MTLPGRVLADSLVAGYRACANVYGSPLDQVPTLPAIEYFCNGEGRVALG